MAAYQARRRTIPRTVEVYPATSAPRGYRCGIQGGRNASVGLAGIMGGEDPLHVGKFVRNGHHVAAAPVGRKAERWVASGAGRARLCSRAILGVREPRSRQDYQYW
jgi:hypothetical protein